MKPSSSAAGATVWASSGSDVLGPYVEAGIDRSVARRLERVRCDGCCSMVTALDELERALLDQVRAVRAVRAHLLGLRRAD